jgi:hypothetical protein
VGVLKLNFKDIRFIAEFLGVVCDRSLSEELPEGGLSNELVGIKTTLYKFFNKYDV